jgi:hypothetical protein
MKFKCSTYLFLVALAALVSGCSYNSKIVYSDTQSVTVDHNFDMFDDGMNVAVKQCNAQGRKVKHESTSCQAGYHRCVSTFKCTKESS